jgi:predicted secreted protein
MRIISKFVFLIFILVSSLPPLYAASYGDMEKRVVVHVPRDQLKFSIQLVSNPTTGYRWQLLEGNDKKEVVLVSHTYHAPTHSLVGAAGFERWVFKRRLPSSLSPQKITLFFVYARPWESQPGKKILFEVVF